MFGDQDLIHCKLPGVVLLPEVVQDMEGWLCKKELTLPCRMGAPWLIGNAVPGSQVAIDDPELSN
jgi:hypothetical protein